MKHILLGFIAVLSLMLVPLILMHKGKGGGFSNFAESLTGSAGSSGVAEKEPESLDGSGGCRLVRSHHRLRNSGQTLLT